MEQKTEFEIQQIALAHVVSEGYEGDHPKVISISMDESERYWTVVIDPGEDWHDYVTVWIDVDGSPQSGHATLG